MQVVLAAAVCVYNIGIATVIKYIKYKDSYSYEIYKI